MLTDREELVCAVEGLIGIHFPTEHRRLLVEQDGWSAQYGDLALSFFGAEDIRTRYLGMLHDGTQPMIDFVPIAAHGSRQLLGYDRRVDPSPVVMVDDGVTDWSAAMLQGISFGGFVRRMEAGKGLNTSTSYAHPAP